MSTDSDIIRRIHAEVQTNHYLIEQARRERYLPDLLRLANYSIRLFRGEALSHLKLNFVEEADELLIRAERLLSQVDELQRKRLNDRNVRRQLMESLECGLHQSVVDMQPTDGAKIEIDLLYVEIFSMRPNVEKIRTSIDAAAKLERSLAELPERVSKSVQLFTDDAALFLEVFYAFPNGNEAFLDEAERVNKRADQLCGMVSDLMGANPDQQSRLMGEMENLLHPSLRKKPSSSAD